jgi:Bardet-Biedl syndrome 1 protein
MSTSPMKKEKKSPWLDAFYDPVAGMVCYSQFMCLCDLHADGNNRLVLVDLEKRIRIYKSATIQWEQKLMNYPTGIICFNHDMKSVPTIAVASGHQVFVYRHQRPHLKYSLPNIELNHDEVTAWNEAEEFPVQDMLVKLNNLRDQGVKLSNRSMDLLAMDESNLQEKEAYIRNARGYPFVQHTAITCMGVRRRSDFRMGKERGNGEWEWSGG